MDFGKRYKQGQKIFLFQQGEGIYTLTIEKYIEKQNIYSTNSTWYILPASIVFETEEALNEYKKTHQMIIDRGSSEWGYASAKYCDYDY